MQTRSKPVPLLLSCLTILCWATLAAAQQPSYPLQRQGITPTTQSPPISPYLSLIPLVNSDGTAFEFTGAYQTVVRPQLEQRQVSRQQTQMLHLRNRLDRVRSQTHGTAGLTSPTGHRPRFQSFTHYYPQLNPTGPAAR